MRVAIVGGDGRQASQHVWDYLNIEVTHYASDETDRLVSSIKNGKKVDAVVVLTKWYGHSEEDRIKNTGVKILRWHTGLKQLSIELPSFVRANGVTNGVATNSHTKVVELAWHERVLKLMQTEAGKVWTSKEIASRMPENGAKNIIARVCESLDRLRAKGLVRYAGIRGHYTYTVVPEDEVDAARVEYLTQREAERTSQRERAEAPPPSETPTDPANASPPLAPAPPVANPVPAPAEPSIFKDKPEDHVADLGALWARARLAKKRASGVVAALEAELAVAREALRRAEDDEKGVAAMLDEME